WTMGLPVSGDGKLVVSTSLVDPRDWSKVDGHATFSCDDCTLGDDATPLRFREPIWDTDRIDFSHLALDGVQATAEFADGRVHLTSRWRSDEFELDARIDGELGVTSGETKLAGCVRFRPTEELLRRRPKMYAVVTTTGAATDD